MKGNISRDSHRPGKRYSGVFQVQGGMVTDADLGEQARIARGGTDGLGHDVAGSGVPVDGGAVELELEGPRLVPGVVYAQGRRGEVQAAGEVSGPLELYGVQVDFPHAPPKPDDGEHIVYADIWERMVSQLEEPLLSDPGLHGAETAFRARTMAQIKFAPLDQADALGQPDGPIPEIGTGEMTVTPADPETIADECDPCADTVAADQSVANALFRIEVVHVVGDTQNPDSIRIAWSAENAAAIAPATVNSEDFGRTGAVYEFYSTVTECHLGVHAQNGEMARSSFATSLTEGPEDPVPPEGGDWPFVRRWDGMAVIDFANGNVEGEGNGTVSLSGGTVRLTNDTFTAEIDFDGRAIVAGDYWLIELRRFADEPLRAVQALPIGIRHSYCPLFRVTDGVIEPLTDAENRRLSFPALANLPATHVGLVNNCPKLYAAAENVQEALDNLCAIEAADIAFDPSGCSRLYDEVDNVQDALINLCRVDFGNERLLQLLHDWGVVCGVIPRRVTQGQATVAISGGAILDRGGMLGDVRAQTVELNEILRGDSFHFDGIEAFERALRQRDVCLALSIGEGGVIRTHLAPRSRAFGPSDPTFMSVLARCRQTRPPFDIKDDLTRRSEAERATLDKVFYGAAYSKMAATQRLNSREQQVARAYNDDLLKRYKTHLNDEAEAAQLDRKIAAIDEEIRPEEADGEVRETRFMMREALVYRAVQETEAEHLRRCLCDALIPRCPEPGERPYLVPIACVEGSMEGNTFLLGDICVRCCRKQAMSWRMVQYFIAETRDRFAGQLHELCCPEKDDDGGVDFARPNDFVAMAELDRRLTPERAWRDVERGARILTGRHPPSDYAVQPDIGNLGLDQARVELAGNGIEVAETIDAGDADAIAKIRGATVGLDARDLVADRGELMPGDKVALIMQEGIAIDYVKVETGGGKFIFERPAARGADVNLSEEILVQAAALDERLSGRIAEAKTAASDLKSEWTAASARRNEELAALTAEAERGLDAVRTEHAALSGQVEALRGELQLLKSDRQTAQTQIEAARATLRQIENDRQTALTQIGTARADLAAFEREQRVLLDRTAQERDTILTSLRREMPISAVAGEETNFIAALTRSGVTNVAGFAEMSDTQLREVAGRAGMNLNTARRLQREAAVMLEGRPR